MENNKLEQKGIFSLLLTMSIPPMISMLIMSLYNIVDSYYVAQISNDALTAVSLAFPLQNICLAISVGIGVAINATMAKSLGEKNSELTNKIATHGFVFTGIHSIIFVIFGLVFARPFVVLFTNDIEIINMSVSYIQIVLCCTFGMQFHILIEKIFQATGNMFVPMLLQMLGAIVNIILDPIFIFGWFGLPKMGIQGAAIATIIGQMSAFILAYLLYKRNLKSIKVDFKHFKFDKNISKRLYSIAIPSGMMMAFPSILVSVLNSILYSFSQVAVNVFGIYFKLQTFVYMPACGIVQGMRPIISYNIGAQRIDRVIEVVKYALLFTFVIMVAGTLIFEILPSTVIEIFSKDQDMIILGTRAFRIIAIGFIFSTTAVVFSGMFEALGLGFSSLVINLMRQLILVILFAIIFSAMFGLDGIWFSIVIAEIMTCVISSLMGYKAIKNL